VSSASDAVGLFNGLGSIGRMTGMRSLCEESSTSFAFDVCTVHICCYISIEALNSVFRPQPTPPENFTGNANARASWKYARAIEQRKCKMIVKSRNDEV